MIRIRDILKFKITGDLGESGFVVETSLRPFRPEQHDRHPAGSGEEIGRVAARRDHDRPRQASRTASHHVHLADPPDAHNKFDHRQDGYTKVLIKFPPAA
jgi:hypothetical protein